MSVSNGQLANQTTFNAAFASKSADNTLTGVQTEANVAPASGSSVTNTQRQHNSIASFCGAALNGIYNLLPTWASSIVGSSTNTLQARAEALTLKFSGTGGHAHTGTDGQGDQVSALSLTSFNQYFSEWGTFDVTSAAGADDTITTQMSGKTPGGGSSTLGVPTSAPNNRCEIRSKDTGLYVEDGGGQRVYGRITESGGVWTLTYYTNESGTETAHTLSSQNITVYFIEVYNANTRPTFGSYQGFLGSLDLTADIIDASGVASGKVNTTAQTFAGAKTFNNAIATIKADVASTATITALSTTTGFVRLTGATATELRGVASGTDGKRVVLWNGSSATITVKHQNAGASASDRIITGDANDLLVSANNGVEFIYDSGASRWVVVSSGAGSGGGSYFVTGSRASPIAITAAGGIAFTGTQPRQLWFIAGDATQIDVTANPQIAAATNVGQELSLVARDDEFTVLLEDGNGLVLNGQWLAGQNSILNLVWDGSFWVESSRSS